MSAIEFDEYELVILRWPEGLPDFDEATLGDLQARHLAYLASMRKAGHLKLSGPVLDQPDERRRTLRSERVDWQSTS